MRMTYQMTKLGGLTFSYSDREQKVAVNGRIVPFTPTEYRLFVAFLFLGEGQACFTTTHAMILSYMSTQLLQEQIEGSYKSLQRHMSNVQNKLAPYGLQVRYFDDGYLLVAQHEQAGPLKRTAKRVQAEG